MRTRPSRFDTGAKGVELSQADSVQDCFRHDGARRIAGAEKEHVERPVGHGTSFSWLNSRR
jgi:hypothetical protein